MREIPDAYLYTIRLVDPDVIKARQIVTANSDEYRGLEGNRRTTQIAFALLYLGLTLIIVLSAIWTGIAVADRLVRPIRQLIGAADEVATGNLDATVPVRASDGDVASLGDTFNKMLQELKSQRNEILQAKDLVDERRRFSEAVLAGVTAGVIGVDCDGTITIVNRSAELMLAINGATSLGRNLSVVLPHVGRVFEIGRDSERAVYREQVTFYRAGAERTFNVQVTVEGTENEAEENSYVVTVDDITDLVAAQRSSAWADVARRIAHEIKNPLTPIQLSAERIRRRYGKVITEDREVLSASTTRPSISSPTGTEMMRPVRLTRSPSLISLKLPEQHDTTPLLRGSTRCRTRHAETRASRPPWLVRRRARGRSHRQSTRRCPLRPRRHPRRSCLSDRG